MDGLNNVSAKLAAERETLIGKQKPAISELLDSLEIRLNDPQPPVNYCVKIGGCGAIPEGDFTLIKGKKKSGKTHVLIMLTTVMCFTSSFGITQNKKKTVCFFDTEQSKSDGYSLLCLMYKTANQEEQASNLHYFSIRTLNKDGRKEFILAAIEKYSPDVIVIDGIRDLLIDFNSLAESQELIQFIKNITDNKIAVIGVLHENKSEFDKNSRGHLGTEAENYAASIISVSKKDGIFTMSETDSRHNAFSDFQFIIDAHGNIQPTELEPRLTSQELKVRRIVETFKKVFKEKDEWEKSDLVNAYFLLIGSNSLKTAYNHLQRALDHDFIVVKNGKYRLSST